MTARPPQVSDHPTAPTAGTPAGGPALADELAKAFANEAHAVRELREALGRQRHGVARDAVREVEASCDDIGRILVTLEAARRTRTARLEALAPAGGSPWAALERAFGGRLPDALAAARRELRAEAEATAHEAAINRAVLRRTIESGEAFLQALFSNVTLPGPTYRAGERAEEGEPGFLLDRKA